jgi:hypothetical protein
MPEVLGKRISELSNDRPSRDLSQSGSEFRMGLWPTHGNEKRGAEAQ